jgi:hypothetical protein
MRIKPCPKFYGNTRWQQFFHICSEVFELFIDLLKKDYVHAAEEVVDCQTSLETFQVVNGYNDRKRATVRKLVADKNWRRGYLSEVDGND